MPWTSSLLAAMLIAQSTQLQSRLSAKAAVREKRKLDPKLPTGAKEVKALPRRRDFEDAADPSLAWAQAVDDATCATARAPRAQRVPLSPSSEEE